MLKRNIQKNLGKIQNGEKNLKIENGTNLTDFVLPRTLFKNSYASFSVFKLSLFKSSIKQQEMKLQQFLTIIHSSELLLCGAVNKLWMVFMSYSFGYMFLSMAKNSVNFITLIAVQM